MKDFDPIRHFADLLRTLREARGLTMEEFCDQYNEKFDTKMNKSTLSRYERGLQEPLLTTVRRMALFFHADAYEVLGYDAPAERGIPVFRAASSKDAHPSELTEISDRRLKLLEDAPATEEDL